MGRKPRSISGNRRNPHKMTKKELKERKKMLLKRFHGFVTEVSTLNDKSEFIKPDKSALSNFFSDKNMKFETNKIHIIQGGNGLGKSTLLRDIANSVSYGVVTKSQARVKYGSNNVKIGRAINDDVYKFVGLFDSFYDKKEEPKFSNLENNFTLYCDFSEDFFKDYQEYNPFYMCDRMECSNGEQKINVIRDILDYIKTLKGAELDKGLDVVIVMDEPESGLDGDIQKELRNKLLSTLKKNVKISITYFIASHSLVWEMKKSKHIQLHDINKFKIESERKIKKKRMLS